MPTNKKGYMGSYYNKNKDKFNNPEEKKKRAARNRARLKAKKKFGARAIANKDVDHKKPLRKGGSNGTNNLRVRSKKANRADNGHKKKK